jgi:hypothetical protein
MSLDQIGQDLYNMTPEEWLFYGSRAVVPVQTVTTQGFANTPQAAKGVSGWWSNLWKTPEQRTAETQQKQINAAVNEATTQKAIQDALIEAGVDPSAQNVKSYTQFMEAQEPYRKQRLQEAEALQDRQISGLRDVHRDNQGFTAGENSRERAHKLALQHLAGQQGVGLAHVQGDYDLRQTDLQGQYGVKQTDLQGQYGVKQTDLEGQYRLKERGAIEEGLERRDVRTDSRERHRIQQDMQNAARERQARAAGQMLQEYNNRASELADIISIPTVWRR